MRALWRHPVAKAQLIKFPRSCAQIVSQVFFLDLIIKRRLDKSYRREEVNNAGKGTKPNMTCDKNADENKAYEYAEKTARNKNRPPYSWKPWASNQCRDFAKAAMEAGQ
jgi:hypothetical protein